MNVLAREVRIGAHVPSLAGVLFVAAAFLSQSSLAQGVSTTALEVLKALQQEKATRTPAQKKLDSNLHYAIKQAKGLEIAPGVKDLPSIKTKVRPDARGVVEVDIQGTISQALLSQIQRVGGQVVNSLPRYGTVRARVPLVRLEDLAAMSEVRNIMPAEEPMTNRVEGMSRVSPGPKPLLPQAPLALDLEARISRVRGQMPTVLRRAAQSKLLASRGLLRGLGLFFFTGSQDSEGDVAHQADDARAIGFNGAGINIGVLSDGVDSLAARQATLDLPAVLTVLAGQAGSGDEGTAMLEIVHDLAPGANLFYATGRGGQATMAANIVALQAAGCDIIIDDLTYFSEGVFQDGVIAQAVNTVTAAGALYFSSAGNSGNLNDGTSGVWEGDFVASGTTITGVTGTLHDFGGGAVTNTLTANGGGTRPITLKWSDPLSGSGNDYDLYILNGAQTAVLCAATNDQDGDDDPFESCPIQPAGSQIVIARTSGVDRALHLNTTRGRLANGTAGQTYGHNAGENTISTAAVPVSTAGGAEFTGGAANPVETYSSDGPRRIFYNPNGSVITANNVLFASNGGRLLNKVDLAAADCVRTTTPGFMPFCGTSAAAPHAGAVAAIIWSALPTATPAQIRSALFNSALDIEAPGWDRDSGVGIVMAMRGLRSLIGFDLSVSKSHAGSFFQGQSGASYTIIVRNNGPATTTGTVRVTDALPPSLTATNMTGPGWSCTLATLTCTSTAAVLSGNNFPTITLTVNVSVTAPINVTNVVTVTADLDTNAANNSASDLTVVKQLTFTAIGAAAGQYSDVVNLSATVTPAVAGTMQFMVNGVVVGTVPVAAGIGAATYNYAITLAAGLYAIRADFISGDPLYLNSFGTNTLTVSKEDATLTPRLSNPTSVIVNSAGGTAGPITLQFDIQEVADGSLGNISLAQPVTFTLTPMLSGSPFPIPGPCVSTTYIGGGVGGTLTSSCMFSLVPVNLYQVTVVIGGNYYTGAGSTLLTVYDPSLGFITGGGVVVPGAVFSNFGFNLKFLKSGNAQGSLLYMEHRSTGDVMLKTNSMGPLVIVGNAAILQAKATLNGVGNHTVIATMVDNGEPGSSDQFGLKVQAPNGNPVPSMNFAPITIQSGNVQVPQPGKK